MNTTPEKPRTRGRIATASLLAAAGAIAGALGAAAPAHALADDYIALALDNYQPGGVTVPTGVGKGSSEGGAKDAAINNCRTNGGRFCEVYITAKNACVALATRDTAGVFYWQTATASTLQQAEQQALAANGGGQIAASGCAAQRPWQQRPQIDPNMPNRPDE